MMNREHMSIVVLNEEVKMKPDRISRDIKIDIIPTLNIHFVQGDRSGPSTPRAESEAQDDRHVVLIPGNCCGM